jgi:hypothetical protein
MPVLLSRMGLSSGFSKDRKKKKLIDLEESPGFSKVLDSIN